jgi:hypothetical protein
MSWRAVSSVFRSVVCWIRRWPMREVTGFKIVEGRVDSIVSQTEDDSIASFSFFYVLDAIDFKLSCSQPVKAAADKSFSPNSSGSWCKWGV